MDSYEVPISVLRDLWVAEYARLLIKQCHFNIDVAVSMGKSALENIDYDIDDVTPSEAVDDEIDAMRACC